MSSIYEVSVAFDMRNGSELTVEWTERRYEATFHDPAETDAGEYIVYIDGDEIDVDELPKGLDTLVEEMYNDPDNKKFSCVETYLGRRPVRPW